MINKRNKFTKTFMDQIKNKISKGIKPTLYISSADLKTIRTKRQKKTDVVTLYIHDLREVAGLSINKLSKISGVSRGYIGELEAGKYKNPTVDILCKIAKGLNCRLDDIVMYQ